MHAVATDGSGAHEETVVFEEVGSVALARCRVGRGHVVQGHFGVDPPAAVDLDNPAPAPGHVDARRRRAIPSGTRASKSGPTAHAPVASAVCSRAGQPAVAQRDVVVDEKAVNSVVRNGRRGRASHGERAVHSQEQDVAAGRDVVVPFAYR